MNLMLLLHFGKCETENAVLRRASSVHPHEGRKPGNAAVSQFLVAVSDAAADRRRIASLGIREPGADREGQAAWHLHHHGPQGAFVAALARQMLDYPALGVLELLDRRPLRERLYGSIGPVRLARHIRRQAGWPPWRCGDFGSPLRRAPEGSRNRQNGSSADFFRAASAFAEEAYAPLPLRQRYVCASQTIDRRLHGLVDWWVCWQWGCRYRQSGRAVYTQKSLAAEPCGWPIPGV